MKTYRNREEGFALIITIALMAFLVLLLVTLTTMTRVETQLANNSQQIQNARENARMALNVAVAQLQRYAGPDHAITARAGINPGNGNNPYWTGIWDDYGSGFQEQTWLVSGNENPADPLNYLPTINSDPEKGEFYVSPGTPDMVRLVDKGTAFFDGASKEVKGAVVAPRIPLMADDYPGQPNPVRVGSYAYWVGDQGVKASMAKTERHQDVNDAPGASWDYDADQIERLRQLLPQRFGPRPLFSNLPDIEELDNEYKERLKRVQSYHQMEIALPDDSRTLRYEDFSSPQEDALRTHFHDITHFNLGVLAGTNGNGLKRDLSVPQPKPNSVRPGGIDDFMKFADGKPLIPGPYPILTPKAAGANAPVLTTAPVITEVLFKYSVWAENPNRDIQVRLDAEVQLWNPYNADLKDEGYFVVVRSASADDVLVEVHHTQNSPVGVLSTNASEVMAVNFSSGAMAPGVIRTIPVVVKMPAMEKGRGGSRQMSLGPVVAGDPQGELWLDRKGDFTDLVVELKTGVDLATAQTISTYRLHDIDEFITDPYPVNDDSPKFGFYVRMRDAMDTEEWLADFDPRAITLDDKDDADPEASADPLEIWTDVQDAVFLSLDSNGELLQSGPTNHVILFEFPTQEVVNMGSLQHVYFHGRGAYALGNPWGGIVNDYFDNYFISTIPQDPTWALNPLDPSQFPVPHTGLIPYQGNGNDPAAAPPTEGLQSEQSARHLLLKGAFNINSTSVDAWRSVLASLDIVEDFHNPTVDMDWRYGNGARYALYNAFFRFSQSAHLRDQLVDDSGRLADASVAWVQGVRPEVEDTEIDILADEIVKQLKNRRVPFQTLAEFVNSGLLQAAIDASGINRTIPRYSPSFITQADIITLLAPFMLARSDTFLVRAYGDSMNPATNSIEGRAWCEAIVQRVPTPFDSRAIPSNVMNPDASPYGQFGRKFEIIYFRWLDPSEL